MKITKKIKNKNSKLNKKVIIIFAVILVILIICNLWIKKAKADKQLQIIKAYNSLEDFTTIEEAAIYMDCELVKQQDSKTEGYATDIYLKIKVAPYTEGKSNQNYYERLFIYLAKAINYENFILIDNEQQLVIGVMCNKDEKTIANYNINGIANYFQVENSKIAIENYKEEKTTEIEINSVELSNLVKSNWQFNKQNFGTAESTISNYAIYFDEGIELRKINTKVFNIIFTANYKNKVINNTTTKMTKDEVIKQLGQPTYTDSVTDLIGYKGKNIYVFFNFTLNEISIYNIEENSNTEKIASLIKQYADGEKDLKTFIAEVKKTWPDFDKYEYDSNYVDLQYSLKGIKIQYNISGKSGITVYNNYTGNVYGDITIDSILNKQEQIPKSIFIENKNLVLEQEKSRITKKIEVKYQASLDSNLEKQYGIYKEKISDQTYKVQIISLDKSNYDKELKEYISTGMWIDNNNYVYSIQYKGIYIYNVKTKEYKTILTGNEQYELKEYKNNELKYDDKSVIVNL